ncbi:GTPase Era, partial [Escherichia coli]
MKGSHKAGFVNIIGNPNVGKSTLMNALVGERLSIITSKAQTTRHRILGIVNDDNCQIIFSDTPGILKPAYLLQENMMQQVDTALGDADIILYVTDVIEKPTKNPEYLEKLNHIEVPVLIVLNKIDKSSQVEVLALIDQWHSLIPGAGIFPVSALERFNLDSLF